MLGDGLNGSVASHVIDAIGKLVESRESIVDALDRHCVNRLIYQGDND